MGVGKVVDVNVELLMLMTISFVAWREEIIPGGGFQLGRRG